MLYLETVESGTFSVLETLMQVPELQDFDLVGGTALSLMYGHRKSIDLDLFSNKPFDAMLINQALINHFPDRWAVRTSNHFGIFGFINDLKIDIIKFPHPLIRPTRSIEGIRMYSAEDIIAMKVQAKKRISGISRNCSNIIPSLILSNFTRKNMPHKTYSFRHHRP